MELRGGGISCSYASFSIFEAIFRDRDLIFWERAHTNIYFTEKLFFSNLDNLEAAPGRPAPELMVKTEKNIKFHMNYFFSWRKNIKIIFHISEAV